MLLSAAQDRLVSGPRARPDIPPLLRPKQGHVPAPKHRSDHASSHRQVRQFPVAALRPAGIADPAAQCSTVAPPRPAAAQCRFPARGSSGGTAPFHQASARHQPHRPRRSAQTSLPAATCPSAAGPVSTAVPKGQRAGACKASTICALPAPITIRAGPLPRALRGSAICRITGACNRSSA